MIRLILTRRQSTTPEQTLGTLEIYKDNVLKGMLMTLEKGWKGNAKNISCIPSNLYDVEHFDGVQYKNVFKIVGVPSRDAILIHSGNFHTQTQGCILVGLTWTDLNDDGLLDVGYSNVALGLLRKHLKGETDIQILIK
jgi:hypothetical protein